MEVYLGYVFQGIRSGQILSSAALISVHSKEIADVFLLSYKVLAPNMWKLQKTSLNNLIHLL